MTNTLQVNVVKKFRKFFSVAFAAIFFISPAFSEETSFIPSQLGTVLQTYRWESFLPSKPATSPTIIHIQDAHESYVVQEKIASLVSFLAHQYHFDLVFEEGNSGRVDTSKVFWVPNQKFVEQVARQLLRERKITGPELAQIVQPQAFKLYGAEDVAPYEANVQSRSQLSFYMSEIENQLRRLESEVKKKIPHVLSRKLRGCYRDSQNFWNGSGYPPFKIDWERDLENHHDWLVKLHALERRKLNALATSARQKKLVEELQLISILRKICRLKATPEDIKGYRERMVFHQHFFKGSLLLKEFFDKALEFYDLAKQRDLALVRNTLEGMARNRCDRAILVSGGFHTQGISQFLRDHGVSYVVIAPISKPVFTETLREPNLFNLSFPEARLFFDLKGMDLAAGEDTRLYKQLSLDAVRFWKQVSLRSQNTARQIPAGLIRRGAVMFFTMPQASSDFFVQDVLSWVNHTIKASPVEFVIAVSHREDVERLRGHLKQYLSEAVIQRKIRVIRLLTPQDFGAANRLLYGKFVFLIGSASEQKRLKLLGLTFHDFLPLSYHPSSDTEGELFSELYQLQRNHRAVVISS